MARDWRELRRAVASFRREQAQRYMAFLSGAEPPPDRAQRWLVSEHGLAAFATSSAERQLYPAESAATLAHMARAAMEQAYGNARRALSNWPARELLGEGEPRPIRMLLGELVTSSSPAQRGALLAALESAAGPLLDELERGFARSSQAVSELLAQVTVTRHADAGPEGGSGALAEAWLVETEDVTREALRCVLRRAGAERGGVADLLAGLAAPGSEGLLPREGRLRRLAQDFEPLGLRRALSSAARATFEHDGPYWSAHVLACEVPRDVRLALPRLEAGLLSELGAAEGVGRAVALVHASRSLPPALLQPTAGTVARAMGALAVQWFTLPLFLSRGRGLPAREAADLARLAAAYSLLESRLFAAAVLARAVKTADRRAASAELCGRALLCAVPERIGAVLTVRQSAAACLRAKVWAPALASALRERFDEDWFRNPRAEAPLRGAFARGGELSVECFAEELAAERSLGIRRLSELF